MIRTARKLRLAIALASVAVTSLSTTTAIIAAGQQMPASVQSADVDEGSPAQPSKRRPPRMPRSKPEHWDWNWS